MSLMNFVDKQPPAVGAAWLNAVDKLKFTVFDDADTKEAARTALTSDAPLEVVNGGTGARDVATYAAALIPTIVASASFATAVQAAVHYDKTADEAAYELLNPNFVVSQLGYPPFHVKRYGCAGGGSVNDTVKMQASYDFVAQLGGTKPKCLWIDPDTYKVSQVTFGGGACGVTVFGQNAQFLQLAKKLYVELHRFADATKNEFTLTCDGLWQVDNAHHTVFESRVGLVAKLVKARNRVSVRREIWRFNQLEDLLFNMLADDVLPATGFLVNQFPFETNHVGKQTLCQSVLSHD